MTYVVNLSESAKAELVNIKKSGDRTTIKKIANMLIELQEHPRTGTGQVEHLKHFSIQRRGHVASTKSIVCFTRFMTRRSMS